eukprot:gene6902-11064_t
MFRNVSKAFFKNGKMKTALKFSFPLLLGAALLSKSFSNSTQTVYGETEKRAKKKEKDTNKMDENVQRDNEKRQIIYKFVLTGGPCAGKSTAMSDIANRLMNLGFQVLIVPEAATILHNGNGFYSLSMTPEQLVRFQASLMKIQMSLEDAYLKIAKSTDKPTILLCDRGLMDGSAYINKEEWEFLLDDYGWSTVSLRDKRYDAIFHLVTAAIGAEDFYTTDNNTARKETKEEAAALDLKLISAWVGHKHLKIFDNSTDFQGKVQRVSDAVCEHVGLPMPQKNVQRKFLLLERPQQIPVKYEEFEQKQTYLDLSKLDESEDLGGFAFVRRRGQNGVNSYTFSRRRVKDDKSAIIERQISGKEYKQLLDLAEHGRVTIQKNVRCFIYKNQYFQIVEFKEPKKNIWVLATNSNGNSKVEIPPCYKRSKFSILSYVFK